MQSSKKSELLDVAIELIERYNLDAITYEALAEASGMSKSGIVYHFPSRYDIMLGVHQHMVDRWEAELERAAGGPADAVDMKTRVRAVGLSQSIVTTKAELLLEFDARSNPEFSAIWAEVYDRWVPAADVSEDNNLSRSRYMVNVIADGFWVESHVHHYIIGLLSLGVIFWFMHFYS